MVVMTAGRLLAEYSENFRYRACGLTISCDVEFPELAPTQGLVNGGEPQVRVELLGRREIVARSEWFRTAPLADGEPFLSCARFEGGYLLHFERLADFAVDRSGAEIICARREPGVSVLTLRHLALDQVLPLVLNLRGIEALHATAVVTPRGACAFVGPAGAGKSTLAASFLVAGYRVMGDDCMALDERIGIFVVPAYPGLRLWNDAFAALSRESDRPIPVADYTPKARLLGADALFNFPLGPEPLVGIYKVIRTEAVSGAPRIEAMSAREAFVELIDSAFPLDVTDHAMLTRHFHFFRRVVAQVPVKSLFVPNDFPALPAVRAAVLDDLGARS